MRLPGTWANTVLTNARSAGSAWLNSNVSPGNTARTL